MVSWSLIIVIAFFVGAAVAFAALPSQTSSALGGVSGKFLLASSDGSGAAFSSFALLLVIASFVFYFSEKY